MRNSLRACAKKHKASEVYVLSSLVLFVALIMAIGTPIQIYQYSQEPVVITGKLMSASADSVWKEGYRLEINGIDYKIDHSIYTKRTYGLPKVYNHDTLSASLQHQLGMEFYLEYLPLAKNSRQVLSFTVGDSVYVDKEIALRDYIGELNTFRWIGNIGVVLTVAFMVIVRKYIYC